MTADLASLSFNIGAIPPGTCPQCRQSRNFQLIGAEWACFECRRLFPVEVIEIPQLEELPSFIAVPLKRCLIEVDPLLRLWNACLWVEASMRFLVLLGVADLQDAYQGGLPDELLKEISRMVQAPLTGDWWKLLQTVSRFHGTRGFFPHFGDLKQVFAQNLLPVRDPKNNHESFFLLRNDLAHKGLSTGGSLLSIWNDRLRNILLEMGFLQDYLVLVWEKTNIQTLRGSQGLKKELSSTKSDWSINMAWVSRKQSGGVAIVKRDGSFLDLWPLFLFQAPLEKGRETDTPSRPHLFSRRNGDKAEFSIHGDDRLHKGFGGKTAFDKLLSLLGWDRSFSPPEESAGFEEEMRSQAGEMHGRENLVASLRRKILDGRGKAVPKERLFWVHGIGGVGKSFIISKVFCLLEEHLQTHGKSPGNDHKRKTIEKSPADIPETLLVPFRFANGDSRCSREFFVTLALERLRKWQNSSSEKGRSGSSRFQDRKEPLIEMKELLKLPTGKAVIFILDGLDDILALDSRFLADAVLPFQSPNVVWVCASRDFPANRCSPFSEEGFQDEPIPPLTSSDMEELLATVIPVLDGEKGGPGREMLEEFIKEAARQSNGLPLYVKYLRDDLQDGEIRIEDRGKGLPIRCEGYHQELLRRCSGLGIFNQVLTPLVCHIATAFEPLTVPSLAEFMVQRGLLLPDELGAIGPSRSEERVKTSLARIRPMLKTARNSAGEEGLAIFHETLREFILDEGNDARVSVKTARKAICDLAVKESLFESYSGKYLLRWGASHLRDEDRFKDLLDLLLRVAFLEGVVRNKFVFHLLGELHVQAGGPRPDISKTRVEIFSQAWRAETPFFFQEPELMLPQLMNRLRWSGDEFLEDKANAILGKHQNLGKPMFWMQTPYPESSNVVQRIKISGEAKGIGSHAQGFWVFLSSGVFFSINEKGEPGNSFPSPLAEIFLGLEKTLVFGKGQFCEFTSQGPTGLRQVLDFGFSIRQLSLSNDVKFLLGMLKDNSWMLFSLDDGRKKTGKLPENSHCSCLRNNGNPVFGTLIGSIIDGKCIRPLHAKAVVKCSFSFSGKVFASIGQDQKVVFCNECLEKFWEGTLESLPMDFSFYPPSENENERLIVATVDGQILEFQIFPDRSVSKIQIASLEDSNLMNVAIGPHGEVLLRDQKGQIRLLHPKENVCGTFKKALCKMQTIKLLDGSTEGSLACLDQKEIFQLDPSWEWKKTPSSGGNIIALKLMDQQARVIVSEEKNSRLEFGFLTSATGNWETIYFKQSWLSFARKFEGSLHAGAFSPDGETLAIARVYGMDGSEVVLEIYSIPPRRLVFSREIPVPDFLALSDGGGAILLGLPNQNPILIRRGTEKDQGITLKKVPGIHRGCLSGNGERGICIDSTDTAHFFHVRGVGLDLMEIAKNAVCCSISADGQWVLIGKGDQRVELFSLENEIETRVDIKPIFTGFLPAIPSLCSMIPSRKFPLCAFSSGKDIMVLEPKLRMLAD
ncbi:MAG: hypothetical protein WA705_03225 [Candidatus Ozemobacteraceae bacterium]